MSQIHFFKLRRLGAYLIFLSLFSCSKPYDDMGNDTPFVWIGGNKTLLKSINDGQTWEVPPNFPATELQSAVFTQIFSLNTTQIFLAGNFSGKLFYYTNNAHYFYPTVDYLSDTPDALNPVAIFSVSPNKQYVVGKNQLRIINRSSYYSFTQQKLFFGQGVALSLVLLVDSNIGYCAGNQGQVFVTHDDFRTYQAIQIEGYPDILCAYNTQPDSLTNNLFMAGSRGALVVFRNKSAQYTTINTGVTDTLRCIEFYNSSTGFISGDNGCLLKTTDGGNTWIKLLSGTMENIHSISCRTERIIMAVGNNGLIIQSFDGGITWTGLVGITSKNLRSVHYCKRKPYIEFINRP
jgi:photosystem II stability/assembly factor-like uncharacterized protein